MQGDMGEGTVGAPCGVRQIVFTPQGIVPVQGNRQ